MRAEKLANEAILKAVNDLEKAIKISDEAGYGSEIRSALHEALDSAKHALHIARQ